jgi:hypothetical protein
MGEYVLEQLESSALFLKNLVKTHKNVFNKKTNQRFLQPPNITGATLV